jgi:hypothetical protein
MDDAILFPKKTTPWWRTQPTLLTHLHKTTAIPSGLVPKLVDYSESELKKLQVNACNRATYWEERERELLQQQVMLTASDSQT